LIPEKLKQIDNWICWTTQERGGKEIKVPVAPWNTGEVYPVSATDKENHTDFETAEKWAGMLKLGTGFVFTESDEIIGIDLDDCIEHGELTEQAEEIVEKLDSFTETSPSGNGLHVYIEGEMEDAVKNDEEGVEIYCKDRYFTVTGDHKVGTPKEVKQPQKALDELREEYQREVTEEEMDYTQPKDEDIDVSSPFWEMSVGDLYPSIPVGENVSHPEHPSKTGQNFRIHEGGETAICWHGQHDYGRGNGCGLCAQHLLAIQETGRACDDVRRNWDSEDGLVFKAWKRAVEHYGIDPNPVPYRALKYIARDMGLDFYDEEQDILGTLSKRSAQRHIRYEYGFDIKLEGEQEEELKEEENRCKDREKKETFDEELREKILDSLEDSDEKLLDQILEDVGDHDLGELREELGRMEEESLIHVEEMNRAKFFSLDEPT